MNAYLYNLAVIVGCVYLIGWQGWSAWWILVAIILLDSTPGGE